MAEAGFDVWIYGPRWEQALPVLEHLNAPVAAVSLPVAPWPATLTKDKHEPGHFSGEATWFTHEVVGRSIELDALDQIVFDKDGWTQEHFEQYVLSRAHLHVTVGDRKCPTLAVLAGYLGASMFVSEKVDDRWMIWLISSWGGVAFADYEGDAEGLDFVRWTFFQRDMNDVRVIRGLTLHKPGGADGGSVETRAWLRQVQLHDWRMLHNRKKLVAPAGSQLAAHDLEDVPRDEIVKARPVFASARSSKHLYELIFPLKDELKPLEVLCAVDGVLQTYVDPATGVGGGQGAHVSDWADWILHDSVAGEHQPAVNPWEGNGPEAELYRLSNNIVEYGEHETSTAQFLTARELQAWLDKSLGKSNAPIVAFLMDDVSFMLVTDELVMMQRRAYDRSEDPRVKVGYYPRPFQPWAGVNNWQGGGHGRYSQHPALQVTMDGQAVDTFMAVNCLDAEDVKRHRREDDELVEDGSWFVLWLEDTGTCIAFPAQGTMLEVVTDNDGASVLITAREYFSRNEERYSELAHELQWARWLDPEAQLTKQEIQDGLISLGQLIERNNS